MPKRKPAGAPPSPAQTIARRKLLRDLGALAVSTHALAALGCGDDNPAGQSDPASTSTAGSSGALAPRAGAAAPPAPAPAPATESAGRSGAAGGPPRTAAAAGAGGAGADGAGSAGSAGAASATNPLAGSGGGPAGAPAAGNGGVGSGASGSGSAGATVPRFDDAASCALTTTDIEGPFYIDEGEIPDDISMVRSDIRDGHVGVEFRLYFRLLDARKTCAPIAGAEVYVWHCDADGYYSGFSDQDPTTPYMGSSSPMPSNLERFCRGIQTTAADGVVGFITIYPGWYAGRPLHIHVMGRIKDSTARLFTTQIYFPAEFTVDVHSSEPAYMARAASIPDGSKNPPSGNPAIPTLEHSPGLVVGTLNVIVDA